MVNYARQRLVASGESLAVDTGNGYAALLEGYSIDQFSVCNDTVDVSTYGEWTRPVVSQTRIELSIASRGRVRFMPSEDADHLFFDPATASVDELLRMAYVKMDERAQHEAQQTLPLRKA